MKYAPVFDVDAMHDYYTDGRCPDLRIEPAQHTQRRLRNHRCVVVKRPNGIRVLTVVTNGTPLIPMPNDTTLSFLLRLQNPDFVLFTDLTKIVTAIVPQDTNASPGPPHRWTPSLVPRDPEAVTPGAFGDAYAACKRS